MPSLFGEKFETGSTRREEACTAGGVDVAFMASG